MLIVVFLRYFKWRWENLHNCGMLLLVCPVGSTIPELVAQVHIDVLGNEELYNLNVSLASGNMKAREADLIFDLRVASAIHELLKCVNHVFLSCKMHGSVSTDVLVVRNVWLGSILEQDLYYGTVLSLHGVLHNEKQAQIIRIYKYNC